MRKVSRFEANLLRLLWYFLGQEPVERVLPLLKIRNRTPPGCLSRDAVLAAQDALAKGVVYLLAKRGGWRKEKCLRDGKGIDGRLWERTSPANLRLSFSCQTLEFLVYITAAYPGDSEPTWKCQPESLTVGDRLLLFLANEKLRAACETKAMEILHEQPGFRSHGLCALAYPQDYMKIEATPDFTPWVEGVGAAIIEALQPELIRLWCQMEGDKERQTSPAIMRQLGESQARALGGFLDAVEKVQRYDLARFVLRAARRILPDYCQPEMWIGALVTSGMRMSDRAQVYQAALAFVHQFSRLQTWASHARLVPFYDEGYQAAQLFLNDWEYYEGESLARRAQNMIRQVDPLRQEAPAG